MFVLCLASLLIWANETSRTSIFFVVTPTTSLLILFEHSTLNSMYTLSLTILPVLIFTVFETKFLAACQAIRGIPDLTLREKIAMDLVKPLWCVRWLSRMYVGIVKRQVWWRDVVEREYRVEDVKELARLSEWNRIGPRLSATAITSYRIWVIVIWRCRVFEICLSSTPTLYSLMRAATHVEASGFACSSE
jgi:hypothetical protein